MKKGITLTGIRLHRDMNDAVVSVEINGKWIEVIREGCDSNFSHIIEPLGIKRLAKEV